MVPGDIEPRLRALGLSITDRLSDAQARWFAEFVDGGEYGLALECLADWLWTNCCRSAPRNAPRRSRWRH